MKIGILTLSASDNCGSLLQGYALKKALSKYGDVEIINFSSRESHDMYDVPSFAFIKRIVKHNNIRAWKQEKMDYESFRKEYMKINERELFEDELGRISSYYDTVVVGSDQVWNVQMRDYNNAFFLYWSDSKKVAYAPSLGGRHLNLSPNYTEIEEWLRSFSFLSVREESGKKCLEEVTGRAIPKVLDPTLIVDKNTWDDVIKDPLIAGDYIFYYSWAYCEDSTSRIVSDKARDLNLPVYVIDPRKWFYRDPMKWGFRLFKNTGPIVFLNLMKHAKICYVESFHGLVFSYLFRKNYWLLDTHKDLSKLDSRLMEFVDLLKAQDRIITEFNVNQIDQATPVRYEENYYLERLRIKSWVFLDKAFLK